ncbi:MAG: S9 family peptidase [Bacteroides sp.]|nr:S9 family peptidase [Bacteroides sp.]
MTLHKILILAAALGTAMPAAWAGNPAVEAVEPYVFPANKPAAPAGFTYLPDGVSYAVLSDDHRTVERYDIRTGKALEPLLSLDRTRELKLDAIEGFTVSPGGTQVLVWTDSRPIYRRSSDAVHYVYDCHSRILQPLSAEHPRQQSPVFSPDNRMVAFVAGGNIYIKKLDFKTEVAVTTDGAAGRVINGVPDWVYEEEFATTCSMSWSPDATTLCYLRYDESDVPTYSLTLYGGTCDPHPGYDLYPGALTYKYPVAGKPNSRVTLHSYDVDLRKVKDITLPDTRIEYIPRMAYPPQGDNVIVATLNRDQNRYEIYSVNPKSTVARSLYVEDSKTWISPVSYEGLTLLSDGFVVNSWASGWHRLTQYSYAGAKMRDITTGDFDVTDYYGRDAAGNHYYRAAAPTPLDRTVSRVDPKGRVTALSPAEGNASATFSPDMQYMMLRHDSPSQPPVYNLCTSAGKTLRTVEDNAAYAARFAGKVPEREFFTMPADGGLTLNGYIIRPAGFDPSRKYPCVMYQYSGPGSQEVLRRWQLDWQEAFAMRGYVVVCVDGRGTGGRGRAFCDIVYRRLGHYETIDQLAAARHAATLPGVDPARIGIFGWSYGGYEALMAASADGAPYAAAVAVAPVTDWRFYDTVYAERYMLTPQQNEDGYRESAPISRPYKLACPTLLMYGTADDNVHPANSIEYISRLQQAGILCDMLVFPNMNHSINGCNSRALVYGNMLRYFDRNLK